MAQITVLGGGAGGHAVAADCALAGMGAITRVGEQLMGRVSASPNRTPAWS